MAVIEKVQFPSYRTREEINLIEESYGILARVREDVALLMETPWLLDTRDIPTLLLGTAFTKFSKLSYQEILGSKYLSECYVEILPHYTELPPSWECYKHWDILMEANHAMIRSIARRENSYPGYQNATRELARIHYYEVSRSPLYKEDVARFASDGFEIMWPIISDFHKEQSTPHIVSV